MARLIAPMSADGNRPRGESTRGAWVFTPQTKLSREIAQMRGFYPVFPYKLRRSEAEDKDGKEEKHKEKTVETFSRQLSREQGKWWARSASEQRFLLPVEQTASSRVKHIRSPNLRKCLPRRLQKPQKLLKYDPHYGAIWPKRPTVDFRKTSGRIERQTHPSLFYEVSYKAVNPHPQSAHLQDRQPRPMDSSLPAHMVKVNTRMGLGVVQHGSLLMNGFPFSCEAK